MKLESFESRKLILKVTLRVRVWIETTCHSQAKRHHDVTLRVRVWIETVLSRVYCFVVPSPSA